MNTQIQVCIIDDEIDGRNYIRFLLQKEFPELQISFEATSVENAYEYLIKNTPDILFLDIQLKDGNAFDLLSRLKKIKSQIIFITAFENFAIQAIKNGAADYLLKPIEKIEFILAVKKALDNISKGNEYSHSKLYGDKINLPSLSGFKLVEIANIVYCEADSNYTSFYLTDKTKIVVSRTLHDFEYQLLENNFFRIHRKYLINLRHLKEFIRGKGGQVVMSDNSVLDVSVRKKNDFLHKIGFNY